MAGEKGWADPRDWEDDVSVPTTGLSERIQNRIALANQRKLNLELLPEISFSIECTDPSHEFPVWLHTITVRYVRGQAKPPIFVRSKDIRGPLIRPLIRDQELLNSRELEETKWLDPKYNQPLTQKAHDHLVLTNQWREKVNLECECGENIPIKNLDSFLKFVKIALDKRVDEKMDFVPLIFFRMVKLPPD